MPTLERYADSSSKSGFYILANVGGGHPITLQVTSVGEKILTKAGYRDEDNVPNKIVWTMFDVGILFTQGSIENVPETPAATEEIFSEMNVKNMLTSADRAELLEYLRSYTGPNQSQVDSLKQKLQKSSSGKQTTNAQSNNTTRSSPASSGDFDREALSDKHLSYSDFSGADFSGADFSGTNINGTEFVSANLSGADFSNTYFVSADLSHADLSKADLSHADLSRADLSHADLYKADLSHGNFSHANLPEVDLHDTDLF